MHGEHARFNWISHVPGLGELPLHVATTIFVGIALMVFILIARVKLIRAMASPDGALIPEPRLTFRGFFEIVAELLYKLTVNILGEHEAGRYYPLVGSIFLIIFVCNLLGLIPGFLPPTDNMNTTLALGIIVFLYYNFVGVRAHGVLGYLRHFGGPILLLAPVMFVLELISHLIRPLSLALRLRGNIMGDHLVLGVFSELVPYAIPVIFMALGLFVAFMQAFVFTLLTMVYISLSTAHEDH